MALKDLWVWIHRFSHPFLLIHSSLRRSLKSNQNQKPEVGFSLVDFLCIWFSFTLSPSVSHFALLQIWVLKRKGRNGRAFLFSHAMNIVIGPKEDRHLMTGLHTVADIYCADCHEVFGWKYERAYEATQKYKEGKFILEKSKIVLYILLNIEPIDRLPKIDYRSLIGQGWVGSFEFVPLFRDTPLAPKVEVVVFIFHYNGDPNSKD
nr:protein yippee-like [Quercus suber]